jgi:hypothetical protein
MQVKRRHIIGFLGVAALFACGGETKKSRTSAAAPQVDIDTNSGDSSTDPTENFELTINPILIKGCSGIVCHGSGSNFGEYISNKDNVLKDASKILERLTSTDPTRVMPRPGFGKNLSVSESETLKKYLANDDTSSSNSGDNSKLPTPTATKTPIVKPPSASITKVCTPVSAADKLTGRSITFAQMQPIGMTSCGGAACHSGNNARGFVSNEARWLEPSYARGILVNINSGAMPIGGRTLSAADKSMFFKYLCARLDI